MDVPCVIIHYLPTIVCGNGRTQEEIGHVSHSRVSSTRLPDKACGITFRGVDRAAAISAEKRARCDVIQYDNIICHVNAALDPSTGHTLHTIQII